MRRRVISKRTFFAGLLFALAACTTYSGIAEFDAYRTAFNSTHQTGNAILDILARKERKIFLNANPPGNSTFNPDYAAYYVDSIDPPGTAAFRRALDSVKAYNDILFGLASGEAAEALSARLLSLNTSLSSAAKETSSLLGVGALGRADLVKTLGGLDQRLRAAGELVDFALKYKSRDDFRRFAADYNPVVQQILVSLRDGTSIIFPVLTRDAAAAFPAADTKTIGIYRKLLSDWVLSLESTIAALNRVSLALAASPTLDSSIAAFTRSAIELEATAAAARRHLAELGAN